MHLWGCDIGTPVRWKYFTITSLLRRGFFFLSFFFAPWKKKRNKYRDLSFWHFSNELNQYLKFDFPLLSFLDCKNYQLEESVKYWSDFMRTRYHPKSFNLIQEYQHENSSQPFDCYLQGGEVWKSELMTEDWTDKVRSFVEECDCLQVCWYLLNQVHTTKNRVKKNVWHFLLSNSPT